MHFLSPYRYNLPARNSMDLQKTRIVVGSTRRPKLDAVRAALAHFPAPFTAGAAFEILGVEVESGVGHTPVNRRELMQGARQRAHAAMGLLREQKEAAQYFVGLEGGLDVVEETIASGDSPELPAPRRVLLESWAYVTDGSRCHYGRSGGIEVPESLAREVLQQGVELSVAIDRFAGAVGIRDAQGAWGVLSAGLIDRTEAFRLAVLAAFAPFYNAKMYQSAASAR